MNSRESESLGELAEDRWSGANCSTGPSGHFSVRFADQPRIVGPHISRRIAALRPHFQPIAGRTYDVDPGYAALRDNLRSR